ncbi:MAG TPA: AsmA-like C-terminal region-containing protein [Vicinamibacterales bacterium]|nr:AsmA-like C-terminal region-containing protein [Vicinamibacterales bacterium]
MIVLALLAAAIPLSSDSLRHRLVATLSDRFDSDVSLGDLRLRIFPRLHVEGEGLILRQRGRSEVPPLITVKSFSVDADLMGLMRKHVAHVQLEELDIEIPPDRHPNDEEAAPSKDTPARSPRVPETAGEPDQAAGRRAPSANDIEEGVLIDTMDSTDARLAIISSHPDKPPKVWNIHTLHMKTIGVGQAMAYDATLTNGIPRGEIVTKGTFGPWQRDEPGRTPLDGAFTFDRADLSIFKGISGILSSRGFFSGTLARIDAHGETDTPDFTINVGGHPFPLHTKYHAVIDGTNGDTVLKRIDASFLQSSLVAAGGVVDTPGKKGREVRLDVDMERARIEDIMKMAVKAAKPPMTGALKLVTKFLLPPGEADVVERLQLDGRFAIGEARFTNYDVQGRINALSHRGRGNTPGTPTASVVSNFQGRFKLGHGVLRLPELQFSVPGAMVRLAGAYGLKRETLDFKGSLLLDAKISQTQTGIKSMLLKIIDPLFKKPDGTGSSIPIKISGTRSAPSFGLDYGRVFHR